VEVPASPETEEPGVGTPTLVHAARINIVDRYAGLSRGEKEEAVRQLVNEAGERHGIDPVLSFAVVSVESSFNHRAVSSDGHESKGLMQLLDSTGRAQLRLSEDGADDTAAYDPFNPPLNIDLGVRYLRELHDMFAQPSKITRSLESVAAANSSALEKLAVAAYNAGQGRVASAQQRALAQGRDPSQYEHVRPYLPQSTQEYVERVMQRRQEYIERFGPLGSGITR
jgi:soluble lytic murein transglycosylase-like protein